MFHIFFKYSLLSVIIYAIGTENISYAEEATTATAEASTEQALPASQKETLQDSVKKYQPCKPVTNEAIAALQFEMTSVKDKISIIDQLSQMNNESLQKCFYTSSNKELVGLTVIELSRHTNNQLAEKAQSLCKRFNIVPYIEETMNKIEKGIQTVAHLLLRIEIDQVKQILDKLPSSEKKDALIKVLFQNTHTILIPTGSDQGDRYYVRATWDTKEKEQVACLTQLFNEELENDRSLDEEKKEMEELNGKRLVYWYSKEWALAMAEDIICCGGTAEFVNGNN